MKKDKSVSFVLTEDEHMALVVMMAKAMIEDKKHYTVSSYTRQLVVLATNGKQDSEQLIEQDDKPDKVPDAKQDTKPNAFSDLTF